MRCAAVVTACVFLCMVTRARAEDVTAGPGDYRDLFDTLSPGDRLVLVSGDYTDGLRITGVHGDAGAPISIVGPADGPRARFLSRPCCNTIDIQDSSYITIQNLHFDGQDMAGIDAIKAGGNSSNYAHHITIEGCLIEHHDGGQTSQQTVGISTKIVAWDWVVRGNTIDGAGTGMYFGNSDGTAAFIGGVIEHNIFKSTLGYNMQIKHQLARETAGGAPTEERSTLIRHNVFIKENNPSPSGARPNLLVGGFPDSGPGSGDRYQIYGNLFYFNGDNEAHLQATGRVHVHDNVFVDGSAAAIYFANHQGKQVIDAIAYNNTIYATRVGIQSAAPTGVDFITANAIFADTAYGGSASGQVDTVDTVANAGNYFANPSTTLGTMDFYPSATGALVGAIYDLSAVEADSAHDVDFNGTAKDFTFRGAYQGGAQNDGWALGATIKDALNNGGPGSDGPGRDSGGGEGADAGMDTPGGDSSTGAPDGMTPASAAGGSDAGAMIDGLSSSDDGGCGCRTVRGTGDGSQGVSLALLLGALSFSRQLRRRRQRPDKSV